MKFSRTLAAAATLLMAVTVMPKAPAHSTPTDVSAEIGCVSTNGGESCDLMLEDTEDPIIYRSCVDTFWLGPCIAPAHDDTDSYFVEKDGSVRLMFNA